MIVVGAGNAAHAAAVSACESGAQRVLMLEKAPEALRGGNTHYSGGVLRLAFDTPDALLRLIPDVQTEFPDFLAGVAPYPAEIQVSWLSEQIDQYVHRPPFPTRWRGL